MATLEWGDTFDHYRWTSSSSGVFTSSNPIHYKWTSVNADDTTWLIDTAYARPGSGGGNGFRPGSRNIYKQLPGGAQATRCVAFWWNPSTSANSPMMGFYDTGLTEQVSVRPSGSNLIVSRNGTTLATSTNTYNTSTWYFIEFKATINNTTGVYEVRVNGSSTGWIPQATGANTRGGTNNSAIGIYLTGSAAAMYDDVWVGDDFPGIIVGSFLRPQGPGNYTQWSANSGNNHGAVDDIVVDDDTTFVQSSTAGQIDTFSMDDLPVGGSPTIQGIQHVMYARQDAGTARTLRPKQRSGGTDYNGTSFTPAATYTYQFEAKPTNPATSAAWTKSDIDGAEFGYELVS